MAEIAILRPYLCDDIIDIVKSFLYQKCSRCKKELKTECFKSFKTRISSTCIECLKHVNLINYVKDHIDYNFRPEYDADVQTITFSRSLTDYDTLYKICKKYIPKINNSYIFRLNDNFEDKYKLKIVNGASLKFRTSEFYLKHFPRLEDSLIDSIYSINDMDNEIKAEYLHIETFMANYLYEKILSTNRTHIMGIIISYYDDIRIADNIVNREERLDAYFKVAEKIEKEQIKKIKLPVSANQTCKVFDLLKTINENYPITNGEYVYGVIIENGVVKIDWAM